MILGFSGTRVLLRAFTAFRIHRVTAPDWVAPGGDAFHDAAGIPVGR
jgi:hypothetical protein